MAACHMVGELDVRLGCLPPPQPWHTHSPRANASLVRTTAWHGSDLRPVRADEHVRQTPDKKKP